MPQSWMVADADMDSDGKDSSEDDVDEGDREDDNTLDEDQRGSASPLSKIRAGADEKGGTLHGSRGGPSATDMELSGVQGCCRGWNGGLVSIDEL
jgi:hypothetical protein